MQGKDSLFQIVHLNKAADFLDFFAKWRGSSLWSQDGAEGWIFRGHSSDKWPLVPKSLRKNPTGEYLITEYYMGQRTLVSFPVRTRFQVEEQILNDWISGAIRKGIRIPGNLDDFFTSGIYRPAGQSATFPREQLLAAACLAQHNGLPTRLLDWSYDVDTAIYFAVINAAEQATRVDYEERGERLAVFALSERYAKTFSDARDKRKLMIVSPPGDSNRNLHLQRGVFTLITTREGLWRDDAVLTSLEEPLENLMDERGIDSLPGGQPRTAKLYKVTLPISEAPRLKRLTAHTNALCLFDDLGSVTRWQRERSFERGSDLV